MKAKFGKSIVSLSLLSTVLTFPLISSGEKSRNIFRLQQHPGLERVIGSEKYALNKKLQNLSDKVSRQSLLLKKVKQKKKTAQSSAGTYASLSTSNSYTGWALDPNNKVSSIELNKSWKIFRKRKDVKVAVIDTGIDPLHPFLRGNIDVSGSASAFNYGVDFSTSKPTTRPKDEHGHGTHVSAIVRSVFPHVKLLPLKYYNPNASGSVNLAATIKALNYAIDSGDVDIINYSGGGPEPSVEELRALKKAQQKGILVVAAAGNENSNIDDKKKAYYPASYGLPNIITVAAYDQKLELVESSNWGKNSVDVMAPGFKITKKKKKNGKADMTGTSQATAFVTGVAALIKSQFQKLNYSDIKNIIVASSKRVKKLKGKAIGGGKLDSYRALKLAKRVHQKKLRQLKSAQKRMIAKKD